MAIRKFILLLLIPSIVYSSIFSPIAFADPVNKIKTIELQNPKSQVKISEYYKSSEYYRADEQITFVEPQGSTGKMVPYSGFTSVGKSWFSRNKWWILAGVLIVAGGAAAVAGGGSEDPDPSAEGSAIVTW